ncbi:MAG: regulatory protein RecX [Lachnospiraceae bacterium]|jgi:Uncharacterized protein conserved in bacteria|nr:regulatory protein RecX [Lachnospiraceae bacterium]
MQIIRISELDKKRVKIVLEDGTCFLLYKAEQRRYDLTEGEELLEQQFLQIREEILIRRARKRAMHLLERMDRTEAQLREKLRLGYYPEDVIEDAVAYVKSYHYVDDLRYAQNYVRARKEQKSQKKLQMELLAKGVPKQMAQQALEEEYQQENERQLILKWIEKKQYCAQEADMKEKRRMYQFLLRKGFQSDDILHVLERV